MISNTLNTDILFPLRSGAAGKSPPGTPHLTKYGTVDPVYRINDVSMISFGTFRPISSNLFMQRQPTPVLCLPGFLSAPACSLMPALMYNGRFALWGAKPIRSQCTSLPLRGFCIFYYQNR